MIMIFCTKLIQSPRFEIAGAIRAQISARCRERCACPERVETDTRRHLLNKLCRLLCTICETGLCFGAPFGAVIAAVEALVHALHLQGVTSSLVDFPESFTRRRVFFDVHVVGTHFIFNTVFSTKSFASISSIMECCSVGTDPVFWRWSSSGLASVTHHNPTDSQ